MGLSEILLCYNILLTTSTWTRGSHWGAWGPLTCCDCSPPLSQSGPLLRPLSCLFVLSAQTLVLSVPCQHQCHLTLPNWWVKLEADKKHLEGDKNVECYLNYKTRSYLPPWEGTVLPTVDTMVSQCPIINIPQIFSLIYCVTSVREKKNRRNISILEDHHSSEVFLSRNRPLYDLLIYNCGTIRSNSWQFWSGLIFYEMGFFGFYEFNWRGVSLCTLMWIW